MKTIKILNEIQKWMQEDFTCTQDFEDARKGKCDMSVNSPNEAYQIDYWLYKSNFLKVTVSHFENVPVNGEKRFFPTPIDCLQERAINTFFRAAFYERWEDVKEIERERDEYLPCDDVNPECDPAFTSLGQSYEQHI